MLDGKKKEKAGKYKLEVDGEKKCPERAREKLRICKGNKSDKARLIKKKKEGSTTVVQPKASKEGEETACVGQPITTKVRHCKKGKKACAISPSTKRKRRKNRAALLPQERRAIGKGEEEPSVVL